MKQKQEWTLIERIPESRQKRKPVASAHVGHASEQQIITTIDAERQSVDSDEPVCIKSAERNHYKIKQNVYKEKLWTIYTFWIDRRIEHEHEHTYTRTATLFDEHRKANRVYIGNGWVNGTRQFRAYERTTNIKQNSSKSTEHSEQASADTTAAEEKR